MKKIIDVKIIPHDIDSEIVFILEGGGEVYLFESDLKEVFEKTGV